MLIQTNQYFHSRIHWLLFSLQRRISRFLILLIPPLTLFYTAPCPASELDEVEQQYLEQKGTITFISQTNYPPFEFVDGDSDHTGMCIELARWVSTEFGFKTRFIDTSFKQAQEMIQSGEADILTSLFYSEKRDLTFDFTQTVFLVPAFIFVAADRTDIKDIQGLRGKRIAMQAGDYAKEYLESKHIPVEIVETTNFAEATDAVIANQADALIGDEQIVLYHLYSNNLTDLVKRVGPPLFEGQNSMAVKKDNALLHSIIQKGISRAREQGVIDNLNRKWLGVSYLHQITFWEKHRLLLSILLSVLMGCTFVVLFFNATLRKKVSVRTKELSDSRNSLDTILMALPVGVTIIRDGNIVWVNQAMHDMFGYHKELLIDHPLQTLYPNDLASSQQVEKIDKFIKDETISTIEVVMHRSDGSPLPCLLRHTRVQDSKGQIHQILIAEDITQQKVNENNLRRAQEEWERTFDSVPDMLMVLDKDYRILRMNRAMEEKLPGTDYQNSLRCFELLHGTTSPPANCPHKKLLLDGGKHSLELFEPNLQAYCHVTVTPLQNDAGHIYGSVHIIRDITEEKLIARRTTELSILRARLLEADSFEQKLRAVKKSLTVLLQGHTIHLWVAANDHMRHIFANVANETDSFSLEVGSNSYFQVMKLNQMGAGKKRDYLRAFEKESVMAMQANPGSELFSLQRNMAGDEDSLWYTGRCLQCSDTEEGSIISIISPSPPTSQEYEIIETIIVTVTQMIQMELQSTALKESEEKFRGLFNSLIDVYFHTGMDGTVFLFSPSVEKLLGYTVDEILQCNSSDLYYDATDREDLLRLIGKHGEIRNHLTKFKRKDGSPVWVAINMKAIPDRQGKSTRLEGLIRDVTGIKKSQDLLVLQRDLAMTLANASNMASALESCLDTLMHLDSVSCAGIYIMDEAHECYQLRAHRGIPDIYGDTFSTVEKDSPQARIIETKRPFYSTLGKMAEIFGLSEERRALHDQAGLRAVGSIPIIHEGSLRGCIYIASFVKDEFDNYDRIWVESITLIMAGAITSILAEQSLKISQLNLATLFQSLDDFLFILDDTGKIVATNPIATNRLGYSMEELHGMNVQMIHPPEHRGEAVRIVGEMLAGRVDLCPIPLLAKDGSRVPVETKVTRGTWNNKPALFGISRDISQRLQAEEEKIRIEERLTAAIEALDEGFVIYDADDRLLICNNKYREIYSASKDVLRVGKTFEEIIRYGAERGQYEGVDKDNLEAWVSDRLAKHRSCNQTLEQHLNDGKWLRIAERKTQDGSIVGFRVDITNVKRNAEIAEQALKEKEVLLREIHHRVKNNMQVISSLLSLQAEKIIDPAMKYIFTDAQARVQSMALVHETLYRTHDLAGINLSDYA